MKNETPATKGLKQIAKKLQQILGLSGIKYPHGKALEAAAQLQGHAGWSVARAASQALPGPTAELETYRKLVQAVARVPLSGELEVDAEGVQTWQDSAHIYDCIH